MTNEIEVSCQKRIVVELPTDWLQSKIAIEANRTSEFVTSLLIAACKLCGKAEVVETTMYSDEAPRLPKADEIWVSYHSIGEEENVWRIKESYVPRYYSLDRFGYSGFSELSRFPERFRAAISVFDPIKADKIVRDTLAMLVRQNESKYEQPASGLLDRTAGYVFFAMQTVHDIVQRLSRIRQIDALYMLAKASAASGIPLLVKRHPYCSDALVSQALNQITSTFRTVQVVNASIHDLIAGARAVVGANSGALFEAALHGKPVFAFGASDFDMAVRRVESSQDLEGIFARDLAKPGSEITQFLGWYLSEYCLFAGDSDRIARRLKTAFSVNTDHESHYAPDQRKGLRDAYARVELRRRDMVLDIHTHLGQAILARDQMLIDAYRALSDVNENCRQSKLPIDARASIDKAHYEKLHATDADYKDHNWLLEYLPFLAAQRLPSIVELGCGNGKFLRAAAPAFRQVTGVDWVKTGSLPLEFDNVQFCVVDISKDAPPVGDLICSADLLQCISGADIEAVLAKIAVAAPKQFHVIACYDDMHSHLAVYEPGTWLTLFRKYVPDAQLVSVQGRHNDPNKIVCTVTNLSLPTKQ